MPGFQEMGIVSVDVTCVSVSLKQPAILDQTDQFLFRGSGKKNL